MPTQNPLRLLCYFASKRPKLMALIVLIAATCAAVAHEQRAPQSRTQRRPPARTPQTDYSQFSHQSHVVGQKLACDSCHKFPTKNWKEVRKGEAAFPDVAEFPEHESCLSCHRTQFFARQRPVPKICLNCHVNATPSDTTRFLFPSLGDVTDSSLKPRTFVSEFDVDFPHDKHEDVVGFRRPTFTDNRARFVRAAWGSNQKPSEKPKSCPVCHKIYQPQGNSSEEYVTKAPKDLGDNFWLKKGTFQSLPNSHTTCFTCHNAESGLPPDSKDCAVCHKLLPPDYKVRLDFDTKLAATMGITDKMLIETWSRRISSGAFRHEAGEHPDLSCTGCHNVSAINTVGPKRQKVPIKSCGGAEGCHITATTDDGGALNFEIDQKKKDPAFVCGKCHITFGKEGLPADHLAAIPLAKPK